MADEIFLSPLEEDMLKELFNLGVGKAARSLSRMVKQEVVLSVPKVTFQTAEKLVEIFGADKEIVSIAQDIDGPFEARSLLLFHEENSLNVVKQMLGSQIPDEMLAELQEEALTEIGNVVLNACIGAISKAMDATFSVNIPSFQQADPAHIISGNNLLKDSTILLLEIDLTLKESDVTGYLAFIFGPGALGSLHEAVYGMLKKMGAA